MTDQPAFVPHTPLPSRQTRSTPSITMCEDAKEPPKSKKPIKTVRSNAGWTEAFFQGFGRKGPGSRPDFDLRPKSLRNDEDHPEICDSCKGTGMMRCSFCSGTKFHDPDGSERICPACNGQIVVTCSVCFGTKKTVELEGNWWEKGIAALFKE